MTSVKLSQAATEYLVLTGQLFKARLEGADDTEVLDKMDTVWNKLTEEEISAMNTVSKALGPIMTKDYDHLLGLLAAAAAAKSKAAAASDPWEKLAYEVAKEMKGLEGNGRVRFEKTRFRIACQGTGIHSDEEWWEDFPIEPLLQKMRASQEKKATP